MGRAQCIIGLLLVATMAGTGIVHADEPTDAILPPNMIMPTAMRAALERLLPQSATLRRQCAVIGAASTRARIRLAFRWANVDGVRARGSYQWTGTGELQGRIEIPISIDFPELVAHELEHAVEQLEGLDLRRLARKSGSGVEESNGGMFETVRAHEAGLAAAYEVEAERRLTRARRRTHAVAASVAVDQRAAPATFEPSHAARR